MAAEIKFEFDEVTVKSVEKKLGRTKSEAPKALKNALNATAKDARKDLAHKAQETYAVKIGGFNKQMKIKPATAGNLVAVIETRGEHLEFKYFSVQGGHGPHGSPLTVLINKHHGRKTFGSGSGAFKNNVAASGQTRSRPAGGISFSPRNLTGAWDMSLRSSIRPMAVSKAHGNMRRTVLSRGVSRSRRIPPPRSMCPMAA